jgi:hypothetical protein
MKRKFVLAIVLLLLGLPVWFPGSQQMAFAAEKTVQLTIPGCNTWGLRARIGSILTPMDGISKFDTTQDNKLVVTYDDEKTTMAKIRQALKKGGLIPTGKPVYLNWGDHRVICAAE